jgi:hypothetical protein
MTFKIEYYVPVIGKKIKLHEIFMFGDIDSVISRFKAIHGSSGAQITDIEAV